MARQTPLLLPPSLEEIKRAAAEINLPEREAIRFFNFYESKGWMVGKNKMCSFRGALENWKLGWEDKGRPGPRLASCPASGNGSLSPGDKMIYQKELERLLERMRLIRSGYAEMQTWSQRDVTEFGRLKVRKVELMKLLGVTI